MIVEILVIFLIIIVVLLFLLFFKTWHIHIIFKNYNSEYHLEANINILLIQLSIRKNNEDTNLKIQLKILNKTINIINKKLQDNEDSDKTDNIDQDAQKEEKTKKDSDLINKIEKITPLLIKSREELYKIILNTITIIKFNDSIINLNIGLKDNNLTIKLCNLLWAITAPLHAARIHFTILPEINTLIIKSDMIINFNLKLYNLLKIIYIVLRTKELITIIKIIGEYDG